MRWTYRVLTVSPFYFTVYLQQQAKNNTVTPSSTTPLTPLSSTPLTPLSKTRTPLTPLSISPGAPLNPLAASSTLVYLPPPPASPSHKPARRRGHSRAKSDTTFLKNISNPMTNPFLWEEEKRSYAMSSSTGQLSGVSAFSAAQGRLPRSATTSREEGVNNNRGCSSEVGLVPGFRGVSQPGQKKINFCGTVSLEGGHN